MTPVRLPKGSHIRFRGRAHVILGRSSKVPGYKVEVVDDDTLDTLLDTEIEEVLGTPDFEVLGSLEDVPEELRSYLTQSDLRVPERDLAEQARRLRYVNAFERSGAARHRPAVAEATAHLDPEGERPAPSTVLDWVRRNDASGGDPRANRPRHHLKGNRTRRKPDFVHVAIERALDTMRRLRHGSVASARVTAIRYAKELLPPDLTQFVTETRDAQGNVRVTSLIPRQSDGEIDWARLVSYEMVRTALERRTGYYKAAKAMGRDKARRLFEGVLAGPDVRHALERGEIDHALLRYYVIDDEVTGLPLGKPCSASARHCHAVPARGAHRLRSPVLRGRRPGPEDRAPAQEPEVAGPAAGRDPHRHGFVADAGALADCRLGPGRRHRRTGVQGFLLQAGHPLYAPSARFPQGKGPVERFIQRMKSEELGYLFETHAVSRDGRGRKRTDKGGDDLLVIRLSELRALITAWIVDVYLPFPHHELGRSPLEVWHEKIAEVGGVPPPPAEEDLVALVGGSAIRTLDRHGVRIFGLKYVSEEYGRFLSMIAGPDGRAPGILIKYDPANIEYVWAVAPDPGGDPGRSLVMKIPCKNMRYARGMSLHAHLVVVRHAKERSKVQRLSMTQLMEAKIRLIEIGEEMLGEADGNKGRVRVARFLGAAATP